jgi:hypothetical protein
MMFIKLTNASPQFKGEPVVLKKDLVVSVYKGEVARNEDASERETVTLVFVPPHGTWEVEETVELVHQLLNQ